MFNLYPVGDFNYSFYSFEKRDGKDYLRVFHAADSYLRINTEYPLTKNRRAQLELIAKSVPACKQSEHIVKLVASWNT